MPSNLPTAAGSATRKLGRPRKVPAATAPTAAPITPFLLSIKALAATTGISKSKLWMEIKEGKIRPIYLCGRTLFAPDEVKRWIAANAQ